MEAVSLMEKRLVAIATEEEAPSLPCLPTAIAHSIAQVVSDPLAGKLVHVEDHEALLHALTLPLTLTHLSFNDSYLLFNLSITLHITMK